MRFRTALYAVTFGSVLFLAPLYSVYAIDSTPSGDLKSSLLQNRQQKIENIHQKFEDRLAEMKIKLASRESELKLKFDKFKDRNKAQTAERINHNLNMINQNQTSSMNKNLDTMSNILDRVVTKAGGTTSSSAQVLAARSAIDAAHTAVATQAGKDYTINVSTESTIQKDAQVQREKLHTDLKTVRELVVAAKQATITAVRSILNPNFSPNPTASPSATLKSKESTAAGLPISQ